MATNTGRDQSYEAIADHINFFAVHEGWGLFDDGVIQRDDEMGVFETDAAAVDFVRARARLTGSLVHQKAIELHDEVVIDAASVVRAKLCERWSEWAHVNLHHVALYGHPGFMDEPTEAMCGSLAKRYGLDKSDDTEIQRALATLRRYA
jgi:hypothetical protein